MKLTDEELQWWIAQIKSQPPGCLVLTICIASEFGASVIRVVDSAEDSDGTGRGG